MKAELAREYVLEDMDGLRHVASIVVAVQDICPLVMFIFEDANNSRMCLSPKLTCPLAFNAALA